MKKMRLQIASLIGTAGLIVGLAACGSSDNSPTRAERVRYLQVVRDNTTTTLTDSELLGIGEYLRNLYTLVPDKVSYAKLAQWLYTEYKNKGVSYDEAGEILGAVHHQLT